MNKLYKLLCLFLCIALTVCHLPATLALESEDMIEISSLEEFLNFSENCRLDSYSRDKHFLLTADIDLTGVDFAGVPTFSGTFDGGNHIISGFNISPAGSYMGLFRYLENTGVVKDLTVKGSVTPTGTRSQIGGIAGSNAGRIENCKFVGIVTGVEQVGGIAGYCSITGVIKGCSVEGIVSGKHFVGGMVGSNSGSITDCVNSAGINITAQQNDIDISDITLETLINSETAATSTDIGGIAGFNDGFIRSCINKGAVGYKHMGYNLGGIAGLQAGYVANCENYGAVSGRKEVGGIAGQQEPQVIIRYDTDTLQILEVQLSVLSDLIKKASTNASANATAIRKMIYKLEKYLSEAEDALEQLKNGLENPKFEDLQSYLDALQTIRDSIDGISRTLRNLYDAIDETMTDLNADMQAISEQMAVIEETLNTAEENLGGRIFDISDEDTEGDLVSKIENCRNLGTVLADLNAGGVVGAVAFENDLDPEEDITVVGNTTLNAIGNIRSVILNCSNSGVISVKNQRAGGIVGYLTMGLIRNCINTGRLDNATADYIGGIAGDSAGYIRGCKVKCFLRGDLAVGGIAGRGSIVSDCFAMVDVTGTEKVGAVLGVDREPYSAVDAPIAGNYYLQLSPDVGAIDGISYDGKAQGLPQADFLAKQHDSGIFSQVTISFLADGEVVRQTILLAGATLTDIPKVPEKQGYTGQWADMTEQDLTCILFDLTFTAAYTAYSSTVQSDVTDEKGRPVLLLQGDFSIGASVTATQLQNFAALQEGQTMLQGWSFIAEQCVTLQTGRMLLPDNVDTEKLLLLVRDVNGDWEERIYRVDGSYIVFSLAKGDDGVALIETGNNADFPVELLIGAGAGALIVILIFLTIVFIRKSKKKKA